MKIENHDAINMTWSKTYHSPLLDFLSDNAKRSLVVPLNRLATNYEFQVAEIDEQAVWSLWIMLRRELEKKPLARLLGKDFINELASVYCENLVNALGLAHEDS